MDKTILLVEDNKHNIRLIEQLISEIDDTLCLVIAKTGLEVFEFIESFNFNLVLMDISLPDMDGISITKQLKQFPKFANVPFIVVTAHVGIENETIFKQIFDDYISKPIDEDSFIEKVKRWINHE